MNDDIDWRWIKSFVEVASSGGMREAAKHSGISQPTLSRHIQLLEEAVGLSLFLRDGRRLVLSQEGSSLFEKASTVASSIKDFERQAVGMSEEETGSVRVTMTEAFGYYFAPAWIRTFHDLHPHITIELVIDDAEVNLLMRDAEIAIRQFKPRQLDLITRYCGNAQLGFFARADYLEEHGTPEGLADVSGHRLIGFDRVTEWIDTANALGFEYTRDDFAVRTDSIPLHAKIAEEGFGIAVLPTCHPYNKTLTRIFPEFSMPGAPVYLTAHPDLRRNPRVLKVWEQLGDELYALFTDESPRQ